MDINKENYTEEELKELFKKLEKIGELCGLAVTVEKQPDETDNRSGISSAKIGDNLIMMSSMTGNAQKFYPYVEKNIFPIYNIKSLPRILTAYMHELAHLLTMTNDDIPLYWDDYNTYYRWYIPNSYFKLPYELLASNLGIKLVSENYDTIMSILMDKDVELKPSVIAKNLQIARDMKSQYIIN